MTVKNNKMISLINGMALISGLVVSQPVSASNPVNVARALAGSSALELPARSAAIVDKAPAADKQDTAIAAVKAAVELNPAAAVAIVSAVAGGNPATAPAVAVAASTLQHKQIGLITKAAAAAAPTEAARISAALIKEFPQDYGVIAIAAAEGAPSAGREILDVVADYVPALQPSIKSATAGFTQGGGNVPVQAILSQVYDQALTSGAVVRAQGLLTLQSQGGNEPTAASGAGDSARLLPPPIQTRTALTFATSTAAVVPAITVKPMQSPVLGPPFIPVLGPPFGGTTTPITIGIGGLTPEQPGGRSYSNPN